MIRTQKSLLNNVDRVLYLVGNLKVLWFRSRLIPFTNYYVLIECCIFKMQYRTEVVPSCYILANICQFHMPNTYQKMSLLICGFVSPRVFFALCFFVDWSISYMLAGHCQKYQEMILKQYSMSWMTVMMSRYCGEISLHIPSLSIIRWYLHSALIIHVIVSFLVNDLLTYI